MLFTLSPSITKPLITILITTAIGLFAFNHLPMALAKNMYMQNAYIQNVQLQNTQLQNDQIHLATAYTNKTLPTLRLGNKGNDVKKLQQILLDNGFLVAASIQLKKGVNSVAIDGIFGITTQKAVKNLQYRYKKKVNGVVTPFTWETIDVYENPYRSPLPWLYLQSAVNLTA